MVNKDGKTVTPGLSAFQASASGADWAGAKNFYLILTNQPGAESWPIVGASFIIVYKRPANPPATKTALTFFDWAYKNGGDMARQLDYVPIPDNVVSLIEKTWSEQIRDSIGKPLWP
jgi:phosphate transport system substrate-binding protein